MPLDSPQKQYAYILEAKLRGRIKWRHKLLFTVSSFEDTMKYRGLNGIVQEKDSQHGFVPKVQLEGFGS